MGLREEYNETRKHKDKLVTEAARAWVENNVVLINEQIDRRTVKRLIDSIAKFEEVFGPYKDKLPALAVQLDAAEEGLERVITGKANEKKASDMLKRLSFLYSTFSRFFNQDLPVLLGSHLFMAPKGNPEVRLDVLQPNAGERYNPGAIRDALRHALEPSKDDLKLLRKIYGKRKVPLVDAITLANQMIHMSFNELEELTGMSKVPMVATGEEEMVAPPTPEEEAPKEGVVPIARESVDRSQKKAETILESHSLLLEINQKNMAKLVDIMNQLEGSFNIAGMEKVNQALTNTVSKARKELAANQWMQGQSAKQLLGFYNLMDNLNQQWPQIQQLFSDGEMDPNDSIDLKKMLTSATKDSVFGKLAKAFKMGTPHAPGLDPASLVNGIMTAVSAEGGIQAVTDLFDKAKGMPKTDTGGEPKLGGQASSAEPAAAAQAAAPAATPDLAQDPAGTQSSAPQGGTDSHPHEGNDEIAQDVASKHDGMTPEETKELRTRLDMLTGSGYKIVKA